ncbi:MAG: sulfite exporter TauE/SafE family protein [Paludibacteraceae bacterium]
MDILQGLLVLTAGFLCGVINIIAGGGSLITLPLLIGLGLPADVANGTNRIGVLLQDISGTWKFQKKHVLPLRRSLILSVPVLIGSIFGILFAVKLDHKVMNWVIFFILLFLLCFMLFGQDLLFKERQEKTFKPTLLDFIIYLAIGFYGGFIQVGMTYLILGATLIRNGGRLVTANAIKIFLNLIILPLAIILFFIHGEIDWVYGILLGIGSSLGGITGVKFAVAWNPKTIRKTILSMIGMSLLYMLFFQIL